MITKIESHIEMLFMTCKKCPTKKSCDLYKSENENQKCPYERQIYLRRLNDAVEKIPHDPEKYMLDISDYCLEHVKYWRRTVMESVFGVAEIDTIRVSAEANKIHNTIIKKAKALGIDRASTKPQYPIHNLPGSEKGKIDICNIFTQINLIKSGKLKTDNPEAIIDMKKKAKKIITKKIQGKKGKVVDFEMLKFHEFGFQELKQLTNKDESPEIDHEKFPLIELDTENERYIPKRD